MLIYFNHRASDLYLEGLSPESEYFYDSGFCKLYARTLLHFSFFKMPSFIAILISPKRFSEKKHMFFE